MQRRNAELGQSIKVVDIMSCIVYVFYVAKLMYYTAELTDP